MLLVHSLLAIGRTLTLILLACEVILDFVTQRQQKALNCLRNHLDNVLDVFRRQDKIHLLKHFRGQGLPVRRLLLYRVRARIVVEVDYRRNEVLDDFGDQHRVGEITGNVLLGS